MFGRKKTHPVVSGDEVYYTPKLTNRDARKLARKIMHSPDVKHAMEELKTLRKFRDMSLSTASNPNNPMENKYARKGRKQDFVSIQRREKELIRLLNGYGIQVSNGVGDLKFMTNQAINNATQKRHFEGCDIMDGNFDNRKLMVYESVSEGRISGEMGSYLLSTIALEEASSIMEENKELVKTYLTAIRENDLSMMAACRDEICARKDNVPNITDIKSDVNTAFTNLSDREKLEVVPSHLDMVDEPPEEIIDDNNIYDIDCDDKLTVPPKPEFMTTNSEDDKARLLDAVKESVNNGDIPYSNGVSLISLINNHFLV